MTPSLFRWLRTKLDEIRLHIPVDVHYVGRDPEGRLTVTSEPPSAMLVRHVVLRSTPEPRTMRRWQIGSLTVDLSLGLPWRWHLANCGMVELRSGEIAITMAPVPVAFFTPDAPSMIRGVVLKGPLQIQVTVGGPEGLVRLLVGGRIMAEVEGNVRPAKVRLPERGIEDLRVIVDSAP